MGILGAALLVVMGVVGTPNQKVIINEIYPAPGNGESEFIELIIDTDPSVAFASRPAIEIRDHSGNWVLVPWPDFVGSRDTLVVAKSAAHIPAPPAHVRAVSLSPWPTLNNGGDSLFVQVEGRIVDRVGYAQTKSHTSIERKLEHWPGNWSSNWAWSLDSSGSTPGRTNSVYMPDIEPPEVLAAEFEDPNQLLIWFSEPLPSQQDISVEIIASNGQHYPVSGKPKYNMITLPWLSDFRAERVRVSNYHDFLGRDGQQKDTPVAYPPLLGQVYVSEILFWEGSEPIDLNGTIGMPMEPPSDFFRVTSLAQSLVSLRQVMFSTGGQQFLLTHPDSTVHIGTGQSYVVSASHWDNHQRAAELNAAWIQEPANVFFAGLYSALEPPLHGVAPELSLPSSGGVLELFSRSTRLDSIGFDQESLDERYTTHKGRSIIRYSGGQNGNTHNSTEQSEFKRGGWFSSLTPLGISLGLQVAPAFVTQPMGPYGLVVSEIMFDPVADDFDGIPDQFEFIELFNASPNPIELQGIAATGYPNEHGIARSIFRIRSPFVLQSKQVALVYRVPSHVSDNTSSQLQAVYDIWPSSAPFTEALFLPVRQPLGLSNTEDGFQLISSSGHIIDTVSYSSRDHYSGLADPSGRSLFREIDLTLSQTTRPAVGKWTTTTHDEGATPGVVLGTYEGPQNKTEKTYSLQLDPTSFYPDNLVLGAQTTIRVFSSTPHTVLKLEIFDREGYLVRTKESGRFMPNALIETWDGKNDFAQLVSTGVYLIVASFFAPSGKLVERIKKPVSVLRAKYP